MKRLLAPITLAFPLNATFAGGFLDDYFDHSGIETVADRIDEVGDACEDNPTVCINNAAIVFDSFFAYMASLFSFFQQVLIQLMTTPIVFVLPV